MPNWVYNTLYVTGDTADLARVREQMNKPFSKTFLDFIYLDSEDGRKVRLDENGNVVREPVTVTYSNPIFAFWNIVAPTDLEAYYGEETSKEAAFTPDGTFDKDAFGREFTRKLSEDDNWYWWNVRNWGTKWDVAISDNEKWAETSLEVWDDGTLMYRMNTAWSPPEDAIRTLSEQYPNLHFELSYEEEQGWGGTICFRNGSGEVIEEYDIPSSHQDFVNRDQDCWACLMYEDADDHLFDDCPRPTLDTPATNVVESI